MRHFPGKALSVQNVMHPILQETLRNFVADTLGETSQEQKLCRAALETIDNANPGREVTKPTFLNNIFFGFWLAHDGTAGYK